MGNVKIPISLGNATENDVLSGVTYTSDTGVAKTGTLTTAPIDSTLTQSGAAADAKVVGDKLKSKMEQVVVGTSTSNGKKTNLFFKVLDQAAPVIKKFKLKGTNATKEFNYEDGMTWAVYCNSSYNSSNLFSLITDTYVIWNNGGYEVKGAKPNDLINSTTEYSVITSI